MMKKISLFGMIVLSAISLYSQQNQTVVNGLFTATINARYASGVPVYEFVLKNNFDTDIDIITKFDFDLGIDSPKTFSYLTFAFKESAGKKYNVYDAIPIFSDDDIKNTFRVIPAKSEYKYLLKGIDYYKRNPKDLSSAEIKIRFDYNNQIYDMNFPVTINLIPDCAVLPCGPS